MNKKAGLVQQVIIHLILIGLLFALFFLSAESKVNSKGIKQQVLEKQTALLIDSAVPETSIILAKSNKYGEITNVKIEAGRIFIYVNSQGYSAGYPYFTRYSVTLEQDKDSYYIKIK